MITVEMSANAAVTIEALACEQAVKHRKQAARMKPGMAAVGHARTAEDLEEAARVMRAALAPVGDQQTI